MRRTWVLSLLILVLPACLHKTRARLLSAEHSDLLCSNLDNLVPVQAVCDVVAQKQESFGVDYRLIALSLEAKLSDIPIPLGSEPIPDFFAQEPQDELGVVLGYTSQTPVSKLYSFFKAECLRLGWLFCGGLESIESLLTFEKPDRICTISLRLLDNSTTNNSIALIITVCPKSEPDNEEVV